VEVESLSFFFPSSSPFVSTVGVENDNDIAETSSKVASENI